MYCNDCGQALVAGQGFCPRCGRASGLGMPPPPNSNQYGPNIPGFWLMAAVERRINALATGWFVYAGLVAVAGLIGLAFTHAWMNGHMGGFGPGSGGWEGHRFGHNFLYGPGIPFVFMKFARLALLLRVGLALAAGVGLSQKATWGRSLAIVAGCLALLHPILGTALGISTLVVLLNAPNAAGYEAMSRG